MDETLCFAINDLTIARRSKSICNTLSLTLSAGDCLGVIGPNGVGKTTLLHALNRLHPWQSGEVTINQSRIASWSRRQLAQSIGLLLQHTEASFPYKVVDCLRQGRFAFLEKSKNNSNALETIIADFDLNELRHKILTTLSGGEQRRVELATLWYQNPRIRLLDEPFNQLDLRHQQLLCQQLTGNNSTSSITLISSHQINLLNQICNKMLLLFGEGEYAFGNTEDMLNKENLARLYQCDLKTLNSNKNTTVWLPY